MEEGFLKTNEFLEYVSKNNDRTWVFLDTETLGFTPDKHQLLEIAAEAVTYNAGTFSHISSFNFKIKLLPITKIRLSMPYTGSGLSYRDIFKMVNYGQTYKAGLFIQEKEALKKLVEYLDSFDDPVIVAHNAPFDSNYLSKRHILYFNRTPFGDYEFLDSLKIMKKYFTPMVLTGSKMRRHKSLPEHKKANITLLRKLLSDLTDKDKIKVSLKLGRVAKALDINTEYWHSAKYDVKMLISVVEKVIHLFEQNKDRNISPTRIVKQKNKKI